jgi:acyl carrier protein
MSKGLRQDGIKVNTRTFTVQEAQTEFDSMFLELEKKHRLTASEMFSILSTSMQRMAAQCVHSERVAAQEQEEKAKPTLKGKPKTAEQDALELRVFRIIADTLEVDVSEIKAEQNLENDLGMDSMDLWELCGALADEFDFDPPEEDMNNMPTTVQGVVDYIRQQDKKAMTDLKAQDDEPAEVYTSDDHECQFTPYDDSDEESWHFLRRCTDCGTTWYSLYCRCERPEMLCSTCFPLDITLRLRKK